MAEPEVAPPVPNPPAEVQEVAFVEDQVRVEDWPLVMVVGEAPRVAVGGGLERVHEFELSVHDPLVQE